MLLIVVTILLMQLTTLESFMLSNRGWALKATKLSMLGMIVGVLYLSQLMFFSKIKLQS